MTIQNHYGNWLMSGGLSGGVVGSCCCGTPEETSVCSTETCGGSNNPTMVLTVFDSDYLDGSGDINWCGKVWTPAEVRAGKTECACPTLYRQRCHVQSPATPAASYYTNHTWAFAGATGLRLERKRDLSTGSFVYATNQFSMGPGGLYSYIAFSGTVPTVTNTSTSYTMATDSGTPRWCNTQPYGQCGVNPPITPDYLLLPAWFRNGASAINISGVAYSWEKGVGWP